MLRPRSAILVGVALVVMLALSLCLQNAPVWDDADLTVRNPYLASFGGFLRLWTADMWMTSAKEEPSSFYRPVAMASYAIGRAVFGNAPAGYHLVNLVLHGVNAALVGLLALRLGRVGMVSAAACALGFGLAPLNVEAVTWLAGRFDLLGTTLLLAALLVNGATGRARYGVVPLLIAALLSKEAFITGGALVAASDLLFHGRRARDEAPKWAAIVLLVALVFVVRRVVGVMSVAAFAATPIPSLLSSVAFLVMTFGRQLLWPAYLDPFRHYAAPSVPVVVVTLAACAALFFACVLAVRARPDDARRRLLLAGVGWAFLTLGPVSVTGPNLEMVGDRYAYLPLVGVFFAVAAMLDAAASVRPRAAVVVAFVAAPVLFAWTLRDRARLAEWRDERALFVASVRDDPQNFYSVYSLGQLDAVQGRFPEAEANLLHAEELRPGYWRSENALCFVWLNTGRFAEAERACLSSVEHMPGNPRAWINLVSVYVRAGKWARCLEVVPSAIAHRPRGAEPVYLRAVCRANAGDLAGAASDVRAALAFEPSHAGANDLARQLKSRGAM